MRPVALLCALAFCCIALPSCRSFAARAFTVAQDNSQGFAAGGDFNGTGDALFGTRYAFVDGNYRGTVGAWWEGKALWSFTATGATSRAWELYWNAEKRRPDVREVSIELARAALSRARPPE